MNAELQADMAKLDLAARGNGVGGFLIQADWGCKIKGQHAQSICFSMIVIHVRHHRDYQVKRCPQHDSPCIEQS